MPVTTYLRFATYAVCAACVVLLLQPARRFIVVDLSKGWPLDPPLHASATPPGWLYQWSSETEVFRSTKMTVPEVIDKAVRELSNPDWKLLRDRHLKSHAVTIKASGGSIYWSVGWVDNFGKFYSVTINDTTGAVTHSPSIP